MTTPNLILIKHSRPEIVPALPAYRWHLSAVGRSRCIPLAEEIAAYFPDVIVSSTEPKAVETAEIVARRLGLGLRVVDGLHEHERGDVGWLDPEQWEARIADLFARPGMLVLGTETADQACERFAGAVLGLIETYPNRSLAVVAHGTVITLFVCRMTGCEPFPFWKRLGLPSFVVLALPGMQFVAVVEELAEASSGDAGKS